MGCIAAFGVGLCHAIGCRGIRLVMHLSSRIRYDLAPFSFKSVGPFEAASHL